LIGEKTKEKERVITRKEESKELHSVVSVCSGVSRIGVGVLSGVCRVDVDYGAVRDRIEMRGGIGYVDGVVIFNVYLHGESKGYVYDE
jgi:hypothetical protein